MNRALRLAMGLSLPGVMSNFDTDGEDMVIGEEYVVGALQSLLARRGGGGGRPGGGGAFAPGAQRGGPGQVWQRPPLAARGTWAHTSKLRSYMGFGFATWGPTDATDKPLPVQPQESFRGERLIISPPTVVGGASAGLVLMRRIDVGTMPQSPSVSQPAPAVMFQNDTVGSNLDLQIAFRATTVQVTLGITAAPGAGVTVTSAVGMFGVWIR